MRIVTINMADGSVSAHKEGCRDIARVTRDIFAQANPADEYATKYEVWEEYNLDFLHEGSGAYDIHFLACTNGLPTGKPMSEEAWNVEHGE